ncbi:MAG: alpha/beta hydrolase [Lachnospiraceae bacterium]|nr:alpha/beta hydrolase [Lachnospiraceae bacterium]
MEIFIDILAVIFVIILLIFLGCFLLTQMFFVRRKDQNTIDDFSNNTGSKNPQYDIMCQQAKETIEWARQVGCEEVSTESFDKLKLKGLLIQAEPKSECNEEQNSESLAEPKVAICVHGYRSFGLYDIGPKAKLLRDAGYNLLIVDNRAHGMSEGKYIGFGNPDSYDIMKWCEFIKDRFGDNVEILLAGLSMGAATVLTTAGVIAYNKKCKENGENVAANIKEKVATTNANNIKETENAAEEADGSVKAKLDASVNIPDVNIVAVLADCGFSSALDEVSSVASKYLHLPYFPFVVITAWWVKVLAKYKLKDMAAKDYIEYYEGHLLIIHGGKDDFVPTSMASVIYDQAKCDKDILIVEDAEHALSYVVAETEYKSAVERLLSKVK